MKIIVASVNAIILFFTIGYKNYPIGRDKYRGLFPPNPKGGAIA